MMAELRLDHRAPDLAFGLALHKEVDAPFPGRDFRSCGRFDEALGPFDFGIERPKKAEDAVRAAVCQEESETSGRLRLREPEPMVRLDVEAVTFRISSEKLSDCLDAFAHPAPHLIAPCKKSGCLARLPCDAMAPAPHGLSIMDAELWGEELRWQLQAQ